MSKAVITESSLSDIGDAIREQLGVSTEYLPSQMGAAVRSISGGGTTDYADLTNKPQINSVELSGNKSSSDLGLQDALTFDATPTSGSTHPVTSGGVYTALSGKVNTSAVGSASGVAELDENGHVPSSQLPSYVDDVVEGYYNESTDKFYEDSSYTTEISGEAGKIYITLDTNLSYRWSGTGFVVISPSLALGETSSTAYRGDRGATAYSTSQTNASAISGINTALGSTDISSIGDGSVTGAISTLNNSIDTVINQRAYKNEVLYYSFRSSASTEAEFQQEIAQQMPSLCDAAIFQATWSLHDNYFGDIRRVGSRYFLLYAVVGSTPTAITVTLT